MQGVGLGDRWNHVELPEPVPNPMFSKAIALLLQEGAGTAPGTDVRVRKNGKTQTARQIAIQDVEKVYLGDHKLVVKNPDGFGDDEGHELAGGRGLQAALRTVDLERTIENVEARLKEQLQKKRVDPQTANNLHLALRYAKALQKHGLAPEDGYMMTKVPVMPANFRKPIEGHDGKLMIPSVNRLYASLVAESNALGNNIQLGFEDDQLKEDRQRLYDSFGALVGARGKRPVGAFEGTSIADAIGSPKIQAGTEQFDFTDTDAKGPKSGYAQDKVVKKKMELSGRTTIIPDPHLHVDEVGLPEAMAWEMYAPFVRQKMSRDYNPTRAKKEVEDRTPLALEYLKREMNERPVLANRAPSWWKYNVMAFRPKLVRTDPDDPSTEKALRMPNLVTAPYQGGDHLPIRTSERGRGLVSL